MRSERSSLFRLGFDNTKPFDGNANPAGSKAGAQEGKSRASSSASRAGDTAEVGGSMQSQGLTAVPARVQPSGRTARLFVSTARVYCSLAANILGSSTTG